MAFPPQLRHPEPSCAVIQWVLLERCFLWGLHRRIWPVFEDLPQLYQGNWIVFFDCVMESEYLQPLPLFSREQITLSSFHRNCSVSLIKVYSTTLPLNLFCALKGVHPTDFKELFHAQEWLSEFVPFPRDPSNRVGCRCGTSGTREHHTSLILMILTDLRLKICFLLDRVLANQADGFQGRKEQWWKHYGSN